MGDWMASGQRSAALSAVDGVLTWPLRAKERSTLDRFNIHAQRSTVHLDVGADASLKTKIEVLTHSEELHVRILKIIPT